MATKNTGSLKGYVYDYGIKGFKKGFPGDSLDVYPDLEGFSTEDEIREVEVIYTPIKKLKVALV